ncbi:alpha/beta hydrolase, partial [Bifidobacterium adolescentis]
MTITLIDEARYDAEMDATVLPALQACMTEGWMEPATVDWEGKALPKLERPGR